LTTKTPFRKTEPLFTYWFRAEKVERGKKIRMNKITTTAGIVALGAASLHAAVDAMPAGTQQGTKPWSVSATLRGFYDSNYSTSPSNIARDSFGFEVSPSASLNLIRDQTAFGLNYVYSYRWYADREHLDLPPDDQAHQVNAKLSHAFTPRYKLDVSDSFVIAQEPELLAPSLGGFASFLRSKGDNLRNTVQGSFSAGITENLTAVLGYANNYYDYDEEHVINSRSAFLDRVENIGTISLRQVILPKTVGVLGYQFEKVDYTSHDLIVPNSGAFAANPAAASYQGDARDNTSHYLYLGVDQGISPTLNASARVGAQYRKYDNLDKYPLTTGLDDENWAPYVDLNATWLYSPGSYAQLGVRHQLSQTDVGFIGNTPNIDAESTSVYGSVNHRIFGGLVASLVGQYQHSEYNAGGTVSSEADDYFLVGLNLTYEINKFLAAEIGYNYDRLNSDLASLDVQSQPRSFDRNRVYIGIRGTY